MRHHTIVDHCTRRGNLSANNVGKSLKLIKAFLVVNATATRHENLCLRDVGNALVGLNGLNNLYFEFRSVELRSKLSDNTLAACIALHLLHHAGTHGRHLWAIVGAHDGCHQVSAKCWTSHAKFLLFILNGLYFELCAVGSKTGLET